MGQREKKKIVQKRKIEFLKQQKANKVKRLKELENTKLPEHLLENLPSTEPVQKNIENTKKVFDDAQSSSDESDRESEDAEKVIDTETTKFKVVTNTDLRSDKYRNNDD